MVSKRILSCLSILLCLFLLFGTSCAKQEPKIRVMSYNVLHPGRGYNSTGVEKPVKDRSPAFLALIEKYAPDVIGLQEAHNDWHSAIYQNLVEDGPYEQTCNGDINFLRTTLVYNDETLELLESEVLYIESKSDMRIVDFALFQHRASQKKFVVFNTHPSNKAAKIENHYNIVLDLVSTKMKDYPDLPVIMTGDYNASESSPLYSTLMSTLNVTDAKYAAEELIHSCGTFFKGGWGGEIDSNTKAAIDHIFINDKVQSNTFSVITDCDVEKISDHLPIYADVTLK